MLLTVSQHPLSGKRKSMVETIFSFLLVLSSDVFNMKKEEART